MKSSSLSYIKQEKTMSNFKPRHVLSHVHKKNFFVCSALRPNLNCCPRLRSAYYKPVYHSSCPIWGWAAPSPTVRPPHQKCVCVDSSPSGTCTSTYIHCYFRTLFESFFVVKCSIFVDLLALTISTDCPIMNRQFPRTAVVPEVLGGGSQNLE